MTLKVLQARFDLLWAMVEAEGLEDEFCDFLEEDYDLYGYERARQIVREEGAPE